MMRSGSSDGVLLLNVIAIMGGGVYALVEGLQGNNPAAVIASTGLAILGSVNLLSARP